MLISRWAVFISFLTIALSGCAGHVTEYRYLDEVSSHGSQDIYIHEDSLNKLRRGKELDRVWISPDFHTGNYRKIYIKPVEIAPDLMNEEQSSQLADYFAKSLQDEIRRRLPLRVITTEEGGLSENVLVLETGLTQLDKSNKLANWGATLAVGYPIDPTHVQVEGRLKDAGTGETLLLFADNRSTSPLLGDNAEAWQKHLSDIARDFVLEIASIKVKLVR